MNFINVDMPKILKSGMTNKFMDFSPQDFEDFIVQLFRDNGYQTEHTKYSGDYGVDVIIKKDDECIAIQVKRYSQHNKVGVQDVNQVLGGRDYYKCKSVRVITTSSYTLQVKNLAQETGVDLWDWNKLQKYICDTYLDGKDYFEYYGQEPIVAKGEDGFDLSIIKVEYNRTMKGNRLSHLVYFKVKNLTDNNTEVSIDKPIYISSTNKQAESTFYLEGYFISGTIYAGCDVVTAFCFNTEHLSQVAEGDKFIFKMQYKGRTHNNTIKIEDDNLIQRGTLGCCGIGLIPISIIFLSAFIYPNKNDLLSTINFHQERTSPILNKLKFKCEFTPSCSEYSKLAIEKYGVYKGSLKSIWRIIRCNPFNGNKGIDYP